MLMFDVDAEYVYICPAQASTSTATYPPTSKAPGSSDWKTVDKNCGRSKRSTGQEWPSRALLRRGLLRPRSRLRCSFLTAGSLVGVAYPLPPFWLPL